jgi:hypothetical protein
MEHTRQFPRLRDDGSFSIVVTYSTDSDHAPSREELSQWISGWIERNTHWVRKWSSGKNEALDFFKDFREIPQAVNITQDVIQIRFEARANSKWWKDWYARFSRQLIDEVPGILGLQSCEDGGDAPETGGKVCNGPMN